jgi:alkanesulfonate monooxygenase SsuD/methylene tetrahydromethanopterin reductase-like flavin-dependent oxidoreductase (luciferase family)
MKFTLTLFGTHPLAKSSPENFKAIETLARAARDNGFDMVWAGQHYLVKNFQKFQPIPALARITAVTGDLYVNVTDLIPLNHPVRLAEELASMDAMTGGRIVLTAALGYADHEFASFGVAKNERLARFLEAIEVIKRLWTQDEVTFEGRFFKLAGVTMNPKPVQKPRPPIWMTADNSKGVIRTAQHGDVWLMSSHNRIAELKELIAVYEEHRAGRPKDFNDIGISRPLMRVTFIAPTLKEAVDEARPYIEKFWRDYYGAMNQAREMDSPDDFAQPFEELWQDRFLLADPSRCVEEVSRYREELGIDCLHFNLSGALEQQLRSLQLLSSKVFPRFR